MQPHATARESPPAEVAAAVQGFDDASISGLVLDAIYNALFRVIASLALLSTLAWLSTPMHSA